ncbi:hypothetical protein EGT74_12685 [Chitinophaga lutea]|uniref:Uncharacterized protein n=1 Tax=Chitinophaga lutea TaxID=2488634 RepID=A0A3N4PK78_9BACT|nr:hypothetical protein [Chitinophaga lutea]RPE07928.1 hypothetical protein EGT74_12685 [Chitinophaga lutea]
MKLITPLILSLAVLSACSKKKDDDKAPSRNVKYEITGNFAGKLLILYNDNVNGNTVVNNATVPWSKEVSYPGTVAAIGIGGNATAAGTPGQTVTVKIYAGGTLVRSGTATAGALGELSLPALAFSF